MQLMLNGIFHRMILRVYVKIIIGLIMMTTIGTTFYLQLNHFNTADPIPEFNIIDEAKQKEFGAFTVKVQTGLFIKNFPAFDMIKNTFIIDCIIWFEFNSDEIMLDTIGKFSFDNGKILQISPPDIRINGNKTFVKYDLKAEFKSNLNYYKFPLEDHRLSIILANNFVTPQEMFFMLGNTAFSVSKNIFISNWIIKDLNTDTGYSNPKLDTQDISKETSYPLAAFMINFAKGGVRKVLIIFIPLFFALFIGLSGFLMNITNAFGRYSLGGSGVTALLGYRFVIEQMMPEVGYFTTTDFIYILLFLSAFTIFVCQLLLTRYVDLEVNRKPDPNSKVELAPLEARLFTFEIMNTFFFITLVTTITSLTAYIVLY